MAPLYITDTLNTLQQCHNTPCTICRNGLFKYSGMHFEIAERLRQWEKLENASLPQPVWGYYSQYDSVYLFVCSQCGVGIFYPEVPGIPAYYDAITSNHSYYVHDPLIDIYVEAFNKYKVNSLLEVGAGGGDFLRAFKTRHPKTNLYALDNNPNTWSLIGDTATAVCAKNIAEIDMKVDAICAFQLLEHLDDPGGFIDNCYDKLNPGGVIMLTVPNSAGLYRHYADSWTETPPHHLTRWTKEALTQLLLKRNFAIKMTKNLPMYSMLYEQYLPTAWWSLLNHINLEKKIQLLDLQNKIVSQVNALGIKKIPFFTMNLLAMGQRI